MSFVERNKLVFRPAYDDVVCERAANRSGDDLRVLYWWEKVIECGGNPSNDRALRILLMSAPLAPGQFHTSKS